MLTIDPRVGSGEFKDALVDAGLPVQVAPMAFGDMAFLGVGEGGVPIPVGIERKALPDFITSCRTKRLQGHQLPGLHLCYRQVWIIIEGTWKPDWKSGHIVVPKGKEWVPLQVGSPVSAQELRGRVMTLTIKGGVKIVYTPSKAETVRFLKLLYDWWVTSGGWDAHDSMVGFADLADTATLVKWDPGNSSHLVRLFAKELKGIGWEKSAGVQALFKTPLDMVQASVKQWLSIPGVGKTLANRIVKVLKGEQTDA